MLKIENICFSYKAGFGIKNINAQFGNHITAILGPNGCGKSTLLKCLTNIYKWHGSVTYNEQKVLHSDKEFFRTMLGYLPQSSKNDSSITVYEAILLGLINTLTLRVTSEQEEKVQKIIDDLEIDAIAEKKIHQLSGGQLQMVLLAQAIIKNPEILFLDEPLNNLDIHRQFSLLNEVTRLTQKNKMITVVVMHDINLASRYAERIIIMKDGEIYAQGKPKDVLTENMMKDIYSIESNIYTDKTGKQVVEFLGIAGKESKKIHTA